MSVDSVDSFQLKDNRYYPQLMRAKTAVKHKRNIVLKIIVEYSILQLINFRISQFMI